MLRAVGGKDLSKNCLQLLLQAGCLGQIYVFFRNERDGRDRRDDHNALRVTESTCKKHFFAKGEWFYSKVKLLLLA